MEIVNERIELLKEQEEMLTAQLIDVRKRKSDCNSERLLNNKEKQRKTCAKYSNVSHSVVRRASFMPTVLLRIENNGIDCGKVRYFLDTGARPNLVTFELYKNAK